MTPKEWRDVTLIGFDTRVVGKARVPATPFLPSILVWANRYFRLGAQSNTYIEAHCYLVPLENMYSQSGMPTATPRGEKK